MASFYLRFPLSETTKWESAYWDDCSEEDKQRENHLELVVGPVMRAQRFASKQQLLAIVRWKSPRSQTYASRNPDDFIVAVTQAAFTTDHERLRIEVLRLLSGVEWSVASTILHLGFDNLYPILDVRALWSAGIDEVDKVVYDFEFWWTYTLFCRSLAQEAGVSMRKLDRSLWGYSKNLQG